MIVRSWKSHILGCELANNTIANFLRPFVQHQKNAFFVFFKNKIFQHFEMSILPFSNKNYCQKIESVNYPIEKSKKKSPVPPKSPNFETHFVMKIHIFAKNNEFYFFKYFSDGYVSKKLI